MKPEISVALTITGVGIDPEDITSSLGLTPTETWRLGDPVLDTKVRRKHDGWRLSSGRKRVIEMESLARPILEKFRSRVSKVAQLKEEKDLYVELACVIRRVDESPSIHFDREMIDLIAELNAEIDIDLYVLPKDKSEENSSTN